jgi:hypothetical protein
MIRYQTPETVLPDPTDHIWVRRESGVWVCCLCGAATRDDPPPYPTPADWRAPEGVDLTGREREKGERCRTGSRWNDLTGHRYSRGGG